MAGACAGMTASALTHPLDTARLRLALPNHPYKGVAESLLYLPDNALGFCACSVFCLLNHSPVALQGLWMRSQQSRRQRVWSHCTRDLCLPWCVRNTVQQNLCFWFGVFWESGESSFHKALLFTRFLPTVCRWAWRLMLPSTSLAMTLPKSCSIMGRGGFSAAHGFEFASVGQEIRRTNFAESKCTVHPFILLHNSC